MHIPRTHTDVGLHTLDIIHTVLMIDAVWTIGHAIVYREDERRIEAELAHNVHEETVEGRAREIASNQLIMLAQCEQLADAWAPLFQRQAR